MPCYNIYMTKVFMPKNSENNIRAQFIKEFNLAFATGNKNYIFNSFAEDAHWRMVGGQSWQGKDAIAEALKSMSDGEALELIIDTIISDGNICAVNGVLKYPEGRQVAYCDIYTFTGDTPDAKIEALTAYAIESEA